VSTSREDTQPRVWDLYSGTEIGRLRGHSGPVKCVQVEGQLCLTGAEDGTVRIWDLRHVGDEDGSEEEEGEVVNLSDIAEEDAESDGLRHEAPQTATHSPCTRILEGHTQAVTALYFEDDCLVSETSYYI
jgi:mitochondrial division protein 1